jgi:hypothetical protein
VERPDICPDESHLLLAGPDVFLTIRLFRFVFGIKISDIKLRSQYQGVVSAPSASPKSLLGGEFGDGRCWPAPTDGASLYVIAPTASAKDAGGLRVSVRDAEGVHGGLGRPHRSV